MGFAKIRPDVKKKEKKTIYILFHLNVVVFGSHENL